MKNYCRLVPTLLRKSKYASLVTACLAFFLVIMNVMIVNVALPEIATNMNTTLSRLQWVAVGYSLTFASLLLSAGSLGDWIGTKKILVCGLVLFVLTSLSCGFALHIRELILFRFLQGIAAALLMPTSLALINEACKTAKERARGIGIWASTGILAGAFSPILSGVLTNWLGWRAIFLVNIPIALVALFLILCARHSRKKKKQVRFDFLGQIPGILSVAALVFSLIEAGPLGLSSPIVLGGFILFILLFTLFLILENHVSAPMFPLVFFKNRVFSAGIMIGMLGNMGGDGILFILPLYFQQIRAYSVFMTGLALIPLVSLAVMGAYLGGRMTSAKGPRLPMMLGTLLGALGFFGLLFSGENNPAYLFFVLPLMMMGFGCSLTAPSVSVAILHAAPAGKTGLASGILSVTRQVGSLLGIAAFGTIVNAATHFVFGMHLCLMIAGGSFLIASVLAYSYICFPKSKH